MPIFAYIQITHKYWFIIGKVQKERHGKGLRRQVGDKVIEVYGGIIKNVKKWDNNDGL